MKKSLIASVVIAGLGLCAAGVFAADSAKFTGVLIDKACGAKFVGKEDGEAGAAKHPAKCSAKDSCAKSGYLLISGKDGLSLDEAGAAKAKEYLSGEGASTKVVIEGTKEGDTLKVTSIAPAK